MKEQILSIIDEELEDWEEYEGNFDAYTGVTQALTMLRERIRQEVEEDEI